MLWVKAPPSVLNTPTMRRCGPAEPKVEKAWVMRMGLSILAGTLLGMSQAQIAWRDLRQIGVDGLAQEHLQAVVRAPAQTPLCGRAIQGGPQGPALQVPKEPDLADPPGL